MKINKLSVRNSTVRPIRTSSHAPGLTSEASESTSMQPPEESTAPATLFKDPNVLKEKDKTTTTTVLVNDKVGWFPPDSPSATPERFHQSLCERFSATGKTSPLPKTSAAAYAALGADSQAFLDWLPTSPDFRKTQGGGGVPTLVNLFRADQGRKKAPEEQECLYTLYDGRLHPTTWGALTDTEREKWNHHRPHVPGPWRNVA